MRVLIPAAASTAPPPPADPTPKGATKRAEREAEEEAKREAKKAKRAEKEAEKEAAKAEKAAAKAEKAAAKAEKESRPKRPRTSYIFFAEERRDGLKAANPESKMVDISRMLGEEWNALSTDAKQVYVNQQILDKERYEREMAEAGLPIEPVKRERKERKERKPKGGKRGKADGSESEDDDDDGNDDDDEPPADYIGWYIPEGFTVQEGRQHH